MREFWLKNIEEEGDDGSKDRIWKVVPRLAADLSGMPSKDNPNVSQTRLFTSISALSHMLIRRDQTRPHPIPR